MFYCLSNYTISLAGVSALREKFSTASVLVFAPDACVVPGKQSQQPAKITSGSVRSRRDPSRRQAANECSSSSLTFRRELCVGPFVECLLIKSSFKVHIKGPIDALCSPPPKTNSPLASDSLVYVKCKQRVSGVVKFTL